MSFLEQSILFAVHWNCCVLLMVVRGLYYIGKRAKRTRHYQGCTNSSWCGICVYIYMYESTCGIIVAHAYVMWAELCHSHFLYVPAVSNIVTTGNGTGTKTF